MEQTSFINSAEPANDNSHSQRLDMEWITINALRETLGIGRPEGSPTYEQTFEFAKDFAPDIFARDRSNHCCYWLDDERGKRAFLLGEPQQTVDQRR